MQSHRASLPNKVFLPSILLCLEPPYPSLFSIGMLVLHAGLVCLGLGSLNIGCGINVLPTSLLSGI